MANNQLCIILEFQSINFKDMVEFEAWRLDFESKNPIKFRMVSSGANSSKDKGVRRYVCNRSGHYKSQGSGKREGHSWKMNGSCTAGLDVKCDSSGSVTVSMCSSHYGHDVEVCDRYLFNPIMTWGRHPLIIDQLLIAQSWWLLINQSSTRRPGKIVERLG